MFTNSMYLAISFCEFMGVILDCWMDGWIAGGGEMSTPLEDGFSEFICLHKNTEE